MKKGIFSSLILASSLFFNSVASASYTDELAQLYPNAVKFNAGYVLLNYFNYVLLVDVKAVLPQEGELPKDTEERALKENTCSKNFDKSLAFGEIETSLLKKFSLSELQALEQFLQTPTGQKYLLEITQTNEAIKKFEIIGIQDQNRIPQTYSQAEKKQISAFMKQHKSIFQKLKAVIHSKATTNLYLNYRQTCLVF